MVSKARSKRNSGLAYGFFAIGGLSPEIFSSLIFFSVIRGPANRSSPSLRYFLHQSTTKPEPARLPFLLPQTITAQSLLSGVSQRAEEIIDIHERDARSYIFVVPTFRRS